MSAHTVYTILLLLIAARIAGNFAQNCVTLEQRIFLLLNPLRSLPSIVAFS